MQLRDVPDLPSPYLYPPTYAQVGDPFAELRVVHLLARAPRGNPIRVRDLVDQLNAEYVDWSFDRPVVEACIVQLQANWMADYRNVSGILLDHGSRGSEVTIEDSTRVDPWIVRQASRLAAACQQRLAHFARDEGAIP